MVCQKHSQNAILTAKRLGAHILRTRKQEIETTIGKAVLLGVTAEISSISLPKGWKMKDIEEVVMSDVPGIKGRVSSILSDGIVISVDDAVLLGLIDYYGWKLDTPKAFFAKAKELGLDVSERLYTHIKSIEAQSYLITRPCKQLSTIEVDHDLNRMFDDEPIKKVTIDGIQPYTLAYSWNHLNYGQNDEEQVMWRFGIAQAYAQLSPDDIEPIIVRDVYEGDYLKHFVIRNPDFDLDNFFNLGLPSEWVEYGIKKELGMVPDDLKGRKWNVSPNPNRIKKHIHPSPYDPAVVAVKGEDGEFEIRFGKRFASEASWIITPVD